MFSRFHDGLSNMFGANPNPLPNRNQNHSPRSQQGQGSNDPNPGPYGGIFANLINQTRISVTNQKHLYETKYSPSGEIDNSGAVMSKISALYFEKTMTDITIVIGHKEYPLHRLILCASSDVFQAMLMGSNWMEAQSERVELQETLECAIYFEDFLKYLYTGIVKLELDNVLHILTLADKYNVKDLVDLCLEHMTFHIPAAANHCKLIQWYKHLTQMGHDAEAESCKNFIKWNFHFAAKAADFIELDSKLLIDILLEDDLVVYDEYSLFLCVNDWLDALDVQIRKLPSIDLDMENNLKRMVEETMECIRFPLMTPRQLADLVLLPVTQKYKEYFMEKMAIGVAYHSDLNQAMDLILQHKYRAKLFTPRHYCSEKWSVCLSVDNFHSFPHYQTKTLVFSTPLSFSEKQSDKQTEWVLDLYPKGVCFGKFYLIVWQGSLECPDQIMKTVRLAVHCKNEEDDEQKPIRVQIGILIAGVENDVEHVKRVIKKNYIFSGRDKVLNFDDIIPYNELVRSCLSDPTPPGHPPPPPNYGFQSGRPPVRFPEHNMSNPGLDGLSVLVVPPSTYLCNGSLKIRIVITPMSEINI